MFDSSKSRNTNLFVQSDIEVKMIQYCAHAIARHPNQLNCLLLTTEISFTGFNTNVNLFAFIYLR